MPRQGQPHWPSRHLAPAGPGLQYGLAWQGDTAASRRGGRSRRGSFAWRWCAESPRSPPVRQGPPWRGHGTPVGSAGLGPGARQPWRGVGWVRPPGKTLHEDRLAHRRAPAMAKRCGQTPSASPRQSPWPEKDLPNRAQNILTIGQRDDRINRRNLGSASGSAGAECVFLPRGERRSAMTGKSPHGRPPTAPDPGVGRN